MASDLIAALQAVLDALNEHGLEYALCGGLAMAVYGRVRATEDIDIVVPSEQIADALEALRKIGYSIVAHPMRFPEAGITIRRISRPDPDTGELTTVDLLMLAQPLAHVLEQRTKLSWEGGDVWVLSPSGLATLKALRSSGVDRDDIAWLEKIDV
ncbi:MAG: nucleotidyltransferase family protein [Acidobacteria bacterium]|nr:nucleotidyltransferase family protein [Acidobacteriota bacterium]